MEQASTKTINFERYTVTVSVPMHQNLISLSIYSSLSQVEKKFAFLSKYSKESEFETNYIRARVVCTYARACGAKLQSLQNGEGVLQISLSFSNIEMLNRFTNNVDKKIVQRLVKK